MSKRVSYRRYRRTYPKQKWQLTLVNPERISLTTGPYPASSFYAIHKTICQTVVPTDSSAHSVVSSNNIVKVGNFKVKGTFNVSGGTGYNNLSMIIYVIFVPQGIIPDNTEVSNSNLATSIFYSHPEWVLGWTRVDLDDSGSNDNFSITSRLKRNLNSGDSVQFGVLIMNNAATSISEVNVTVAETIQYAARAN